jgi:CRISPR system Cascade subunit CasE
MFLARLILDPRSRRVRQEMANPYEMHRTVMHAFPEQVAKSERVLYRLETNPRTGVISLLVQSHELPDWSFLGDAGGRGYLLACGEPNPAVKAFEPVLQSGQELFFKLRANPTVCRDSKRVGLYREEEQFAWLGRKAAGHGFQVSGAQVVQDQLVRARIRRGKENHELKLLSVLYEGALRVLDPVVFTEAIRWGIGSGKGLGFGLLSVARVTN